MSKYEKDRYILFWFITICLTASFMFGCQKSDDLTQAKKYSQDSDILYKRAVDVYEKLIHENKDLNKITLN